MKNKNKEINEYKKMRAIKKLYGEILYVFDEYGSDAEDNVKDKLEKFRQNSIIEGKLQITKSIKSSIIDVEKHSMPLGVFFDNMKKLVKNVKKN